MALSVCLLLDERADRTVRALWQRLEDAGIPTLLTHTHGRHQPHLTLASLIDYELEPVREHLSSLPAAPVTPVLFDALGMFRRSRCWLGLAPSAELVNRQRASVSAVVGAGARLHRSYEPGAWVPHLTLAPRLHLEQLATVARHTFEVLPVAATLDRAVLVETTNGAVHPLPHAV
jgi:2'-5' RNA ligase